MLVAVFISASTYSPATFISFSSLTTLFNFLLAKLYDLYSCYKITTWTKSEIGLFLYVYYEFETHCSMLCLYIGIWLLLSFGEKQNKTKLN